MASAPFSVSVKEAPSPNHVVTFQMDLARSLNMETNPELLADFVNKLAQVMKSKPEAIGVRDVSKDGNRTILSWSNNSLPYKVRNFSKLY